MKRGRLSQLIYRRCGLAAILFSLWSHTVFAQSSDQTPPNFKIAFIGDQGSGSNATAVLNLIKNEGANAVMHQGDFDYNDNPQAWDNLITEVLGANFPYFASIGNHDEGKYFGAGGYQSFLAARMNRLGITWDGDLGIKSSFKFNGIFIILVGPGVSGSGHDIYIRDKLAADNSIWSISSWHKNMKLMQVGGKSDDTGWGVYEESRKGGAIIATAHEHSYSRTHLLSSCQNQTVASTSNTLVLTEDQPGTTQDEGKTFVFVSGLGGKSIRSQSLSGAWWASIYTSTQNAAHGALFGVFNVDGMPNKAHFYFKAINGAVPDDFYVISNVIPPQPPSLSSFSPAEGPFGTEVTINGSNFTGATQVKFNEVATSNFVIVSESEIRAEVPAGAATGKISVTTPGGTTASADDFIVTPPPQPAISSFTPLSGPVGTQVTIAGNFFTGATEVAFNGVAASNFTVVSNSQIRANVPTGATTGTITVTAPGGIATSANDFTVTILSTANLALNKPASASSTDGSNTPSKAVDGSTSTYWRSGSSSTGWLRVDLGSEQTVGRAVVKWNGSYYAKKYQFQVSNDDANWTTVYTNNSGTKGTKEFTFAQTPARYVRLYMTKNNKSSYRINELEVYSSAASALAGVKAEGINPAAPSKEIVLHPNYPNPFNPSTAIAYSIPEARHITIKVYDLAGQVVATLVDGYQNRGDHQVIFDATGKPSGFYFVVLKAEAEVYVRRLLFMK
jgi:hypothetical protein